MTLLRAHRAEMETLSPLESVHALDVDALLANYIASQRYALHVVGTTVLSKATR